MQVPALPALQDALPLQTQAAAVQTKLGGQGRPHAPQLAGSVARFLQPAGFWQQVWPAVQAEPPLQVQTMLAPDLRHHSP